MAVLASELQTNFQYSRHKPEETVLYQIVQSNLANFIRQVEVEKGYLLPDFILKVFREYLECGILTHGFLRLRREIRILKALVTTYKSTSSLLLRTVLVNEGLELASGWYIQPFFLQ
jgi:hypothetical protein